MLSSLPFDRVLITAHGRRQELSAAAFLELPIHVRVGYVLQREVAFFAAGQPVALRAALQALRRLAQQSA